ncbi:MAG: FkbM family methyltransferase [Cyclobacteriaceae bacterium]
MKKLAKRVLLFILGPIIRRLGYIEYQRMPSTLHGKDNLLDNFFRLLLENKFRPKHILDIGANHGTWTRNALTYFPETNFTMIEPQEWLSESSKDLVLLENVEIDWCGVGAKEGEFNLTVHDRDDSSTFRLTEQEAKARGFKQVKIPVKTVDQIIGESSFSNPEIIKIDAEGMDLEVLKGAERTIKGCEFVLIEAGVMNLGFDNSVIRVIKTMDSLGFRLFDLTDLNRPFKQQVLWLVELVFVRIGSNFDVINYRDSAAD